MDRIRNAYEDEDLKLQILAEHKEAVFNKIKKVLERNGMDLRAKVRDGHVEFDLVTE